MAAARRQLAAEGAAALSLRSVARELGMVSSAVYRYFESRDALLTGLIVDAYDALGAAAEAAAETRDGSDLDRWVITARAIREWALDHPHEYALLYGSPVPGYAAPETTITSGTGPSLALVGIVARAATAGRLAPPSPAGAPPLSAALAAELTAVAGEIGADAVPPEAAVAFIGAWTQLFGLVSFELFGQTRNMVVDNAALFDATVTRQALALGLR
ncbi:MAG: TetR/AcrR family transcriptional regulator [Acidimicrobiia bacterium]|nr:TetR/AcrR family transcriptional regulator [Acidimicrobiia bacterium]